LASSICALDAIIQHAKAPATARDHAEIDIIMLCDPVEVGSKSAQGADSNMLVEVSQRLYKSLGG
jgi:aspartyl aminopeptidase